MDPRRVLLISNDSAYMLMFRSEFMAQLVALGCQVAVAAPHSDRAGELAGLGVRFLPLDLDRGGLNPLSEYRTFRAVRRAIPVES